MKRKEVTSTEKTIPVPFFRNRSTRSNFARFDSAGSLCSVRFPGVPTMGRISFRRILSTRKSSIAAILVRSP